MKRVAVWSCSKRTKQYDQPAWKKIKNHNPDFCIDLGDSWYFPQSEKAYKKKRKNKTIREMDRAVKLQREDSDYSILAEKSFTVYDDHCFASNNSGSWLPQWVKDYSKYLKLEVFKKVPGEVRKREGLYYSHDEGDIRFIFLDVRTFREKYGHIWLFGRGFIKKKGAHLLGLKQWKWFQDQLKSNHKRIVICSGSTFKGKDGWSSYKEDRKMLTNLIKHSGKKFLLLTGDIHKNKFSYHDDLDCYEVTTSGVGRDNLDNFAILEFESDAVRISLFSGNRPVKEQALIDF